MADARSKVTLRPRSKLERMVGELGHHYAAPPRPTLSALSQLVLMYLLDAIPDKKNALGALSPFCSDSGEVDAERLAKVDRSDLASRCSSKQVILPTIEGLRAAGELALAHESDLTTACQAELPHARKMLMALPHLTLPRVDYVLLSVGAHPLVAPSPSALIVASRLGYPGSTYEAVARALDAELPNSDGLNVAWRAHHFLDRLGRDICALRAPSCHTCPIRSACSYQGSGDDPAKPLATG